MYIYKRKSTDTNKRSTTLHNETPLSIYIYKHNTQQQSQSNHRDYSALKPPEPADNNDSSDDRFVLRRSIFANKNRRLMRTLAKR